MTNLFSDEIPLERLLFERYLRMVPGGSELAWDEVDPAVRNHWHRKLFAQVSFEARLLYDADRKETSWMLDWDVVPIGARQSYQDRASALIRSELEALLQSSPRRKEGE